MLRRLFQAVPAVTAGVFVDVEGECIDYVASLDPYDAKVAAAHMHVQLAELRHGRMAHALGDCFAFEVVTDRGEIWVRRIADDYALVVLLTRGFDASELRDAMSQAGREFRAEVGISEPAWERHDRLSVRVRTSPRWDYAPAGFSLHGERHQIAAVLGRWTERARAEGQGWVCFRVRTQQGEELTLAHDERTEVWWVRRA